MNYGVHKRAHRVATFRSQ